MSSKPVYDLSVDSDLGQAPSFPPPAASARPVSYEQAPPPAMPGAAEAPTWPPYSASVPDAPYTSPAPTTPPAGWGAPTAEAVQAPAGLSAPAAPETTRRGTHAAAPAYPAPTPELSLSAPAPTFAAPLPEAAYPPPAAALAAPSFAELAAPSLPAPTMPAPISAPVAPPVAELAAPVAPPASAPAAELPAYTPPPAPTSVYDLQPDPAFAPPSTEPAWGSAPEPGLNWGAPSAVAQATAALEFAPPVAPEPSTLSFAEQLFAEEGVSSTLESADPDLIAALSEVLRIGASDLHVATNAAPMLRVDGVLAPGTVTEMWGKKKVDAALRSILTEEQAERFDTELELDFAYTISSSARFRVNLYQQRGALGAAFRLIPTEIKQLSDLGVPGSVAQFATLPRGLVLITGPTGSGKSTTLAALVDLVNRTRADHIMTVEDPIEFLHGNQKSLVNQREVGHDTHSFAAALKHVLRQDPDVILIGELRDLETISVALTAAETGHLVFATLHTQSAGQTIDRIIDVFPPHQQGQVRSQLAATLQGVVCQTLVKKASGHGRLVATEVLIATPAIGNLIREGKTYQIASAMQSGGDQGMHTMDRHLADLVNTGQITMQAAFDKAQDLDGLKQMIHRVETQGAPGGGMTSSIDFGDAYSVGEAS
jgi:twitching motility protein PilT